MENKNLKKNFFKFPGVISVEGKRNYAYINIADVKNTAQKYLINKLIK